MPAGRIFNIQRFCIHDGPGIRTTVFLKGCPLACPWCHNPEGLDPGPELLVVDERCLACGACRAACPTGLSELGGKAPLADPALCRLCGLCANACPAAARRLVGCEKSVDEILATVERERPFFEASGGGITFSGGEPLAQAEFLIACLKEARRRGLHTAVDTSGFAALETVLSVAACTDLFLYDVKTLDPQRHLLEIGAPLAPILDNLCALDDAGAAIWIRVPFVPGFNDRQEDIAALGALVAGLHHTRRLHLLPCHRYGATKPAHGGPRSTLRAPTPPATSAVVAARDALAANGLDVRIGG